MAIFRWNGNDRLITQFRSIGSVDPCVAMKEYIYNSSMDWSGQNGTDAGKRTFLMYP